MKNSKVISWEEVLNSDVEYVIVLSYGYTEHSIFGGHFEPFRSKRKIKFEIDRYSKCLYNPTFFLEEDEKDLYFEITPKGIIFLDDPDIWCRPDY